MDSKFILDVLVLVALYHVTIVAIKCLLYTVQDKLVDGIGDVKLHDEDDK